MVPEDAVLHFDVSLEVDDLIVSPLSRNELAVRVRRVLKRTPPADNGELVRAGDLVINPASYEVSLKGHRVSLRFKEYGLLLLLASNPGRAFDRATLLNRVWGYQYYGGTRTVDVHIRRLRSKLKDAEHHFIETVWNVGYRFRVVESSMLLVAVYAAPRKAALPLASGYESRRRSVCVA